MPQVVDMQFRVLAVLEGGYLSYVVIRGERAVALFRRPGFD